MRSCVMELFLNCAAAFLDGDRFLDCCFIRGMHRRQLLNVQDMHAEVPDLTQTQPGKSRDCFADSPENIFDRIKRVAAANSLK